MRDPAERTRKGLENRQRSIGSVGVTDTSEQISALALFTPKL